MTDFYKNQANILAHIIGQLLIRMKQLEEANLPEPPHHMTVGTCIARLEQTKLVATNYMLITRKHLNGQEHSGSSIGGSTQA